jgi:hypothetical protein
MLSKRPIDAILLAFNNTLQLMVTLIKPYFLSRKLIYNKNSRTCRTCYFTFGTRIKIYRFKKTPSGITRKGHELPKRIKKRDIYVIKLPDSKKRVLI